MTGKILVVEDDEMVAEMLGQTLTDLGYDVVANAHSGTHAIEEFGAHDPDLILMDIQLSGKLDGIKTAEKIRAQADVPIIFLTADSTSSTFERAKLQNAYGYLQKPFRWRDLEVAIKLALSRFKEHQEKEADLEESLLNSEKLGTEGTLASGIIQDIKGSLAVIQVLSEKLKKLSLNETGAGETLSETVRKIQRHTENINHTVTNYQSLIQTTHTERPEVLQLRQICSQAQELNEYAASANRVKLLPLPQDSATVYCGRASLLQVLTNLIRNSIDAVSNQKNAWITLSWKPFGSDRMVIQVMDSGSGIPVPIREKVFKPLFTTKPIGKGTGLGLTLCRNILVSYAGTLEIDLNSPHTCFEISLPKRPLLTSE